MAKFGITFDDQTKNIVCMIEDEHGEETFDLPPEFHSEAALYIVSLLLRVSYSPNLKE